MFSFFISFFFLHKSIFYKCHKTHLLMRRFVCLHFEYRNLAYMCKQNVACAQPTATYKKKSCDKSLTKKEQKNITGDITIVSREPHNKTPPLSLFKAIYRYIYTTFKVGTNNKNLHIKTCY